MLREEKSLRSCDEIIVSKMLVLCIPAEMLPLPLPVLVRRFIADCRGCAAVDVLTIELGPTTPGCDENDDFLRIPLGCCDACLFD